MHATIILGTARKGRQSEKVARFMLAEARAAGFDAELVDVADHLVGATENTKAAPSSADYAAKIAKADAVVVVSPEYNHGYPGELKLLLDQAYGEYFGKPVGICGVSAGPLGGARMVEQLRLVAIELRMWPIREALYFGGVQHLFDDAGEIKDPAWWDRAKTFFAELSARAAQLKKGRETGGV